MDLHAVSAIIININLFLHSAQLDFYDKPCILLIALDAGK